MLALGLVLVVLAVTAVIAAVLGGSNHRAGFDLGLFEVETNTLGVFLLGATAALMTILGLEMIRSGVRRSNRRRRRHRELEGLVEEAEARDSERGTSGRRGSGGTRRTDGRETDEPPSNEPS